MNKIIICLILILSYFTAWAYEPIDSAVVYFRIGHRQFDSGLGDNGRSMENFLQRVRIAKDINNIDRIEVRAYASPDGASDANARLTGYRCDEITNHIIKESGVDPSLIHAFPEGIAWDELRKMVAADKNVPSQEQVLNILDNTPVWIYDSKGKIVDGRKRQLQALDHGVPYRWMFNNLFPALRNAVATSLFLKSDAKAASMDSVAGVIDGRLTGSSERLAAAEKRLSDVESKLIIIEKRATAAEAKRAAEDGLASTAEGHEAVKEGLDAADKGHKAVAEGVVATKEGREAAAEGLSAVAKGREAFAQDKLDEAETLADLAEQYADAAEKSLEAAEEKLEEAEDLDQEEAPVEEEPEKESVIEENHIPVHRFALKTNILFDAALMPNLEFQWRINPLWSLSLEADVAWWKNDPKHKYYQILMVSPEVRRFVISRGEWHGMYVGLFAGGGKYDLENGKDGYKGEGGMAGLSAGYMWPISRNLSLEAGIGAGYLFTRYKQYTPFDGHYLYLRTKNLNYFGPLKLKFSLVWRFDDINKHR